MSKTEPSVSIAEAVAAEREACAKIADDWLTTFGEHKPQFVSAQKWACDAIKDIAEEIRQRTLGHEK